MAGCCKCGDEPSGCEISSSHGGEYDVQSCLLGYTAVYHFTRQYNPEDSSEQPSGSCATELDIHTINLGRAKF
jgi:hypothetical protein